MEYIDTMPKTTEKPVFELILNELRKEISKLGENSEMIFSRICNIQDIRRPTPIENGDINLKSECLAKKPSIINELDEILRLIRFYNDSLDESKRGLIKLIG